MPRGDVGRAVDGGDGGGGAQAEEAGAEEEGLATTGGAHLGRKGIISRKMLQISRKYQMFIFLVK